jgi:hypothetical protein
VLSYESRLEILNSRTLEIIHSKFLLPINEYLFFSEFNLDDKYIIVSGNKGVYKFNVSNLDDY